MQQIIGIIGTAIAGPVFALQILSHPVLSKAYKPILFDRSKDPRTIAGTDRLQTAGAAVALFGNGIYPLYQLGLKDAFNRISLEPPTMSIWDARTGYFKYLGCSNDTGWAGDLQRSVSTVERRDLQSILIDRVEELGGQIYWEHNLDMLERTSDQKVTAIFGNATHVLDLVVGADGAYSKVRKHILRDVNPHTAEERWMPEHSGVSGIYGISSAESDQQLPHVDRSDETHGVWLSPGYLALSPLQNGKIGWDLYVPETESPRLPKTIPIVSPKYEAVWESKIMWNNYSHQHTAEILQQRAHLFNPVFGTFGSFLESAERIYHLPLRQRVWELNEIQNRNIVLIGDASRLMLPSSGQGTSFAIEDATVLANALLNNPPDEAGDHSAALQEYGNARLPRSKKMASMAHWTGKIAMGETWYWRGLRRLSSMALSLEKKAERGTQMGQRWPLNERCEVELRAS